MIPRAPVLGLLATGCGFADIVDDRIGTLDADVDGILDRLEALESENAALQARVDALEVGSGATGWILEDTTWVVPGDHATLAEAMDAALDVRIWPDAVLVVRLEDGDHPLTETIAFRHPDGDRMQLIGNPDTPTAVRVVCPASGCLDVSHGKELGLVSAMILQGRGAGWGVSVTNLGRVTLDASVTVRSFDVGLSASDGGMIRAPGVRLQNNDVGVYADGGAMVVLDDARVLDSNGIAVAAWNGGRIHAYGADVRGGDEGFVARAGAIWAPLSSVSDTRGAGYRASDGGDIVGTRTEVVGSGVGFEAFDNGLLVLESATSSGNTISVSLDRASRGFLPELTYDSEDGAIRVFYRSTLFAPVVADSGVWTGESGAVYAP